MLTISHGGACLQRLAELRAQHRLIGVTIEALITVTVRSLTHDFLRFLLMGKAALTRLTLMDKDAEASLKVLTWGQGVVSLLLLSLSLEELLS